MCTEVLQIFIVLYIFGTGDALTHADGTRPSNVQCAFSEKHSDVS